MKKNRGIIHVVIIIVGIVIALILLGFFNSVEKNSKLVAPIQNAQ